VRNADKLMPEEGEPGSQYRSPAYIRNVPVIVGYTCLALWSIFSVLVILLCLSTYQDYTSDPMMALSSSCQKGFAAAVALLLLPPFLVALAYHSWRWRRKINLIMAGFCAIMSLGLIGGIALVDAAGIEQPETCS